MAKIKFQWVGNPLLLADGPIVVREDGRLMVRDIEYTQNGIDFEVETETPDRITLELVPVPRWQQAEFEKSELHYATRRKDD